MTAPSFPTHQLRAEQLESIRGDRVLFSNLNVSVCSGEVLRIEGENGAGKTTLLRILTGIGFASEGSVFWNDKTLSEERESFHANLHYLGHQASIKMALTPLENLAFFQTLNHQQTDEKAIMKALQQFGLSAQIDLPCAALSAGQKRRVALCRLLLVSKPLWILDEPFTALDSKSIDFLEARMHEHQQNNGLLILTTHQDIKNSSLDFQSLYLQGSER